MTNSAILTILNNINSKEVYFGPQGFKIMTEQDELNLSQLGFSRDDDGSDLTGTDQGKWHSNWLVIAMDLEMGDPYFIDTSKSDYPVYTAIQGESFWHVEEVTPSLKGFITSLNYLQQTSCQTESLFVADETTITNTTQLTALQQKLIELSAAEVFWSVFFSNYLDWLEEDDY